MVGCFPHCTAGKFIGTQTLTFPSGDSLTRHVTVQVKGVPASTFLGATFPNPFSGLATIPFGLTESANVRARIFDVRGRLVRTLCDEFQPKGYRRLTWDGRDESGMRVASGIYILRLEAGQQVFARPLQLLR